ncbi:hypothetical protein F4820DRAFT_230505 [Hypoxylon rubiginosum]|uniref:Uncharacterized protein n=1 Tax=Hypoxylon rubiginosum TaxID=110542 RepID=A0ACB9YGA9_9PEZI|nr:hypothetical protein F4820DRAFT_230505 [Hypoxylon rubiginosum]
MLQFLTTALRHLLANPAIMAKLRAELASHSPAVFLELPYLSGVILEAHRQTFGLMGRHDGDDDGDDDDDDNIFFPDPLVFDTGRWLGPEGAERREKHQPAFPKGPRACVRMHFEMASAIGATTRYLFETDGRDVTFLHGNFYVAVQTSDSNEEISCNSMYGIYILA